MRIDRGAARGMLLMANNHSGGGLAGPTNFTATPQANRDVVLAWSDAPGAFNYNITQDGVLVGTVAQGVQTFTIPATVTPLMVIDFADYADATAFQAAAFIEPTSVVAPLLQTIVSSDPPGSTKAMRYEYTRPRLVAAGSFHDTAPGDFISIVSLGTTDFTAVGAQLNAVNPIPVTMVPAGLSPTDPDHKVEIVTLGNTDWVAMGFPNDPNNLPAPGKIFTATGAGTGTGTANLWFHVTGPGTGTGTANSAGATTITTGFGAYFNTAGVKTNKQEIWIRFWLKYSPNFTTGGQLPAGIADPNDHKLIHFDVDSASGLAGRWLAYIGSASSPNHTLDLDIVGGGSPPGNDWINFDGTVGQQGAVVPNLTAFRAEDIWASNTWHEIKIHIRNSTTNASNDAIYEEWIDGTRVYVYRGFNVWDYLTGGHPPVTISGFSISHNQDDGPPGQTMYTYWGPITIYDQDPGWSSGILDVVNYRAQSAVSADASTSYQLDTRLADLLIVGVESNAAGTVVLSDTVGGVATGNTWHPLTAHSDGHFRTQLYWCKPATVGVDHIVNAAGTGIQASLHVLAVKRSQSAPFVAENGNTSATNTVQTGSVTPAEVGDLIVTMVGYNFNDDANPPTINDGFTLLRRIQNGAFFDSGSRFAYKYATSGDLGGVNPTWTVSNGSQMSAAIAVFKGA